MLARKKDADASIACTKISMISRLDEIGKEGLHSQYEQQQPTNHVPETHLLLFRQGVGDD
jgi:hypothetical protein